MCHDCSWRDTTIREDFVEEAWGLSQGQILCLWHLQPEALAFAQQLELTDDTVEALTRFCSFTATIYIPHFLASSIGCDSVVNDIQLFKKLFAYGSRDQQLAEEALVVLKRHCW